MRFLRYFILIFLFLPFLVVFAGDISQITFTNDPRVVKPNEAALLTIHLEYSGDSHPTACMLMSSDSGTAQFSSNGTTWDGLDKLTINSNWANKNFYYKDSSEGDHVLTVKVVPVSCSALTDEVAQWTASQNIVVSSQEIFSSAATQTPAASPVSNEPERAIPEIKPTIKAYAGKDKAAVVGVLTEFRGMGYGFDDKPLENARYVWNFGNGTVKEGQNIFYYYEYPGEYVVALDVSSGKESVLDTLIVKVIPNEIYISEIKPGINSFIELGNNSNDEVNLSRWVIRAGLQNFVFPSNTFIRPRGFLVLSGVASGIILEKTNGVADLLYPGASVADSFLYKGILQENQSFSCDDAGNAIIALETPGRANGVVKKPISGPVSAQTSQITPTPKSANLRTPDVQRLENQMDQKEKIDSQEAGVVVAVGKDSLGPGTYVWIILGLALFAGAGFLLIRRQI